MSRLTRLLSLQLLYRVSHMLVDPGWFDFDLGVPPSRPAAQSLLPNSHQDRQYWGDSGTLKFQFNPTQFTSRWDTLYAGVPGGLTPDD